MACLRSVQASRIASPNRALYRFTRSLSSATGPSFGAGGAAGGLGGVAAGGLAAGAAGTAGGLDAGSPPAAGVFAAGDSGLGDPDGCFSSGSLAMNSGAEQAARNTHSRNANASL